MRKYRDSALIFSILTTRFASFPFFRPDVEAPSSSRTCWSAARRSAA